MNKYKVQFHCHTKKDPSDWITHTEEQLLDEARRHGYDVLSITCHDKIIFDDALKNYAADKDILLIPGMERTVEGKHVLMVNVHEEAEQINTFADLKAYKKAHPKTLIVAPHPYHPFPIGLISLQENLDKNLHLFDAIEWSCFRTRKYDFNKKAFAKAKKHGLPMLGTADNHVLKFINHSYSIVDAHEKTTEAIISAIRKGNVTPESIPFRAFDLIGMTARLIFLEQIKKIGKLFKSGQ